MTAWIQFGLSQSKNEMIYLPKQMCLIIIHRNTTHIIDISCCHKNQQYRYMKLLNMYDHTLMYVVIFFSLTKTILIMFELVTTY